MMSALAAAAGDYSTVENGFVSENLEEPKGLDVFLQKHGPQLICNPRTLLAIPLLQTYRTGKTK